MVPASLRCRATSRPEPRSRPPCGGPRRLLASCCLPSAACYLSPAACCLPPSVYCLTPVARCLPSAARCLPSAATAKCQTRPPPADHCLPPVVCHHGRPPSAAPPERRTSPPATTRTLPPIRLIDATIGIAPAPLSDMPPTIPLAIPCGLTPATTHKPKPQNFNDLSSDFEIHSGELHAKLPRCSQDSAPHNQNGNQHQQHGEAATGFPATASPLTQRRSPKRHRAE